MSNLTYPGVYIKEVPSGVRTIAGVSTSIAMFIGRAQKGELNKPMLCLSYEDFERAFSSTFANSDLARSVKLFFANGGNRCYVMRIADMTVARSASVTLQNEANVDTLQLEANSQGLFGDSIRVHVDYDTAQPEVTFNLSVFRWEQASSGVMQQALAETHINLSMDPNHSRYAVDVINRDSNLVSANDMAVGATSGYSQSGFAVSAATDTVYRNQWMSRLGAAVSTNRFMLSVDGIAPREVDLSSIDFTDAAHPVPVNNDANTVANLAQRIEDIINNDVFSGTGATVTVAIPAVGGGPYSYPADSVGPAGPAGQDNEFTSYLRITSASGNVLIEPATTDDLAVPLMLGSGQGGVEVGRFASARPAPSGTVTAADDLVSFAEMPQAAFDSVVIDGTVINVAGGAHDINTTSGAITEPRMYQDAAATDQNDGRRGVAEKLAILAAAINDQALADPGFTYSAKVVGNRLSLQATAGGDNRVVVLATELGGAAGPDLSPTVVDNTRFYALGDSGLNQFQTPGLPGLDGTKPLAIDYENAYRIIDSQVDLFNLLVLPRDHDNSDAETRALWGPASVFCQKRRAMLLMDPPDNWSNPQQATDAAIGVNSLRVGLVKNRAAVFYPKVTMMDNQKEVHVGPTGAIAGLIARIDGTRGVWKAPAGTEADLRGIVGIQHKHSDAENGVMNPKAINNIRLFPNGIVNWGGRTMDGDDGFGSEWKYIPIVRTAMYIEESLYRGLKWAVFEPNDEPLWSQIRLNVGAFMHNLFRQGAFQGQTPKEAYYVQCDSTTTTQNDRNLGIVNIHVGFAPLKPAEFVVLQLQQLAGQVQV